MKLPGHALGNNLFALVLGKAPLHARVSLPFGCGYRAEGFAGEYDKNCAVS